MSGLSACSWALYPSWFRRPTKYSPSALSVSTGSVLTKIEAPFVPEAATSCFAFVMSGAVHLPLPGFFVYGQYGLWPGEFGGRTWQVGPASLRPPLILARALRAVA